MILTYAVIALVVLAGVWTGATWVAAQSFRPLLAVLALLLAGAGACYVIGAEKTGHAYAGLLASLMTMQLLLVAGALGLGALLRGLHDATRRRVPAEPGPPLVPTWNVWGFVALTAAAVIIAALE